MQVKSVSVFAHGCCTLVINYSQPSSETQCSMALRSEMSFYLEAQHLIILCSTHFFPRTRSTLQQQNTELKKTSMPIIMSLSLCSCCVFIVSHIWCNCQLMKAKRTAKCCAVLRFSFLLLLAGLHEHGDSASWFIGQLIIVLRKLRVNEWPHLSSHLSFPATSSLLRRLSF